VPKADLTELARDLERHLGDPHDPTSGMPFERILELDEREEYPYAFVNLLHRWGLQEYSMPAEQGGRAGDVEVGFNLMRLVARRDPTTAAALLLTNLSFMAVWASGTDGQKRALVASMQRGGRYAWALSERQHGSDLLGNEMTAEKVPGGYLLTGEKWLIGNARVADGLCVQARTDPKGGPAGYSVFVLDKRQTPAGSVDEMPNEPLHGLRALDLSGVRLDRVFVPDEALIGRPGQGLETVIKTSQTARTVISAIALSTADTALRVTLDFAERRVIFDKAVADVPYSRRQLTECFADLMIADAVSLGAVRSLQVVPQQASVWSSVVKYFVPTLMERTLSQLSVVLGARFYLRGHGHYGIYQKMLRDLPVSNFADGNTVVNLKNLALQLDALLAAADDADEPVRAAARDRAAVLYGIDRELPMSRPWAQELYSRGQDDALLAAPDSLRSLRAFAAEAKREEQDWLTRAADTAGELLGTVHPLRERCAALRAELGRDYGQSAELFDLAKQYCLVHAVAACVHTFVHSHGSLDDPLPSGALLLLQLERLRRQLHPHEAVTDGAVIDDVMRVLRHLHRENRLFSHWQFPLAERGDLSAADR
jgi:alkylation response protein AidB-like acyl-CoA dehydrogenase